MNDVRVTFTKWGERPHWEYDALRLGEDDHGTWLGLPEGTLISRPGSAFRTGEAQVVLVPRRAAYLATFYAPHGRSYCSLYVHVSTRPEWRGGDVFAVDLDLDVVKGWSGRVWVDDEDEFAEHRISFGYPGQVVDGALTTCRQVRDAVEAGLPPFDEKVSTRWMGALRAAMMMP